MGVTRLALLGALLVLAGTSCGGDDDESEGATAPTTEATAEADDTTTTTAEPRSDTTAAGIDPMLVAVRDWYDLEPATVVSACAEAETLFEPLGDDAQAALTDWLTSGEYGSDLPSAVAFEIYDASGEDSARTIERFLAACDATV
jgi:hypothetical protein